MKTEYVLGFLFNETGRRVVLIQKRKPCWQLNKFNGVGGKVEGGETPEAAMAREFFEETGLRVSGWAPFCQLTGSAFRVYAFVAYSADYYKVKSMTDEPVGTFGSLDLPPSTLPNVHWLIPMALSMARGEQCCAFKVEEMA